MRNAFATLQLILVPIQAAVNGFILHRRVLRSLSANLLQFSRTLRKLKSTPIKPQNKVEKNQTVVFGRKLLLFPTKFSEVLPKTGNITTWFLPQLRQFIRRHSVVVRQIEQLNGAFVAPFYFLALICNVPISASLHSMLLVLYEQLRFAQRAVALNMFALQAVVNVATLTLLGQVNGAIYGCSAPLYSVQAYLNGGEDGCCTSTAHLLQKLKILQYYQLIRGYGGGGGGSGKKGGGRLKLGYTVGSLANISNHSLFTVS